MKGLCGFDQGYRFRRQEKKTKTGQMAPGIEDEVLAKRSGHRASILCRQCRRLVTTGAERITVQGSHQHTFANPQGIIFQIGCFGSAPGCGYTGRLTAEYSWFKGFSWKIAACRLCSIQLGWLFVSSGAQRFNGLVLNRLILEDETQL